MPNKNSHASAIPQRTCVVCKKSKGQDQLISFVVIREGIIIDPDRRLQMRKYYVCPEPACLVGLDQWKKRHMKRHFGISAQDAVFTRPAKHPVREARV